ncbi:MAG: protoporphyrinogen oxidase [Bacteroidota bacterium]
MTTPKKYSTIILGGGLSGLASAFYLKQKGEKFLLIEKEEQCGGVIQSFELDGAIFDKAAISFSLTPEIQEMISALGIEDQLLYPKEQSKNRFIYSANRLHRLRPSPLSILTTSLLSWKAKRRLLKESKVSSRSDQNESVADFIRRRFGNELYEKIGNAVMGGIYAGDPEQMEAAFVLKRFVDLEKKYGSLTKSMKAEKGRNKRISVSFKKGTQDLTKALEKYANECILCNTSIEKIVRKDGHWEIQCESETYQTERIISCLPSYVLANVLDGFEDEKKRLLDIRYCQVTLLHLLYSNQAIGMNPNGFGFLIPKKEEKPILGAVMNSTIFKGRVKEDQTAITLFIGDQNFDNHSKENIKEAQRFLEETLQIKGEALTKEITYWPKAIPQFHMGYSENIEVLKSRFAKEDFILNGNYVSGVSVGDVIKYAKDLI